MAGIGSPINLGEWKVFKEFAVSGNRYESDVSVAVPRTARAVTLDALRGSNLLAAKHSR